MKKDNREIGQVENTVITTEPMLSIVGTVSPELLSHKGLFDAEIAYRLPLRLVFIALLTYCDQQGRFCWDPSRLKQEILPLDTVDMSKVLDALFTSGFVKKHEEQGKLYGCIPLVDPLSTEASSN